MLDQFLSTQPVRSVQIFYYSSHNHILINTVLIETLTLTHIPENIRVIKTQINQPKHHVYGQAPFISVNSNHIVKKQQLYDFLVLILGIQISDKYQFLSVLDLSEEISEASNLFCQYDQNPYFLFLSPWKKYKRYKQLQDRKHSYRTNSHYYNQNDDSLNRQYFVYRINCLGNLIEEYKVNNAARPQYLYYYKIVVFALMKHLRVVQNTLYLTLAEVKAFKQAEQEIQKIITQRKQQIQVTGKQVRPPARQISFTNVVLNYLKQDHQRKKLEEEQPYQYENQKEKLLRNLFKPAMVTILFVVAMNAFK